MICVLSSAKTFSSEPCEFSVGTAPLLPNKTAQLLNALQIQTPENLEKLFQASEKIADINYGRYQDWDTQKEKPALERYDGDAFKSLKSESLTAENWKQANAHIAILSGLYGILRATDNIRPYRLEMGTRTRDLLGETLYDFWKESVLEKMNQIIHESGAKYLLNMASKEYFSVIDRDQVSVPIIDIEFKTQGPKGLRTIAIHAKRARGAMAGYVLENQLTESHELIKFSFDGYHYSDTLSSETILVFLKE